MRAKSIERATPTPTAAPLPNLGRYEALGQLAAGATGSVYLARLRGPGDFERLFAIKLLHAHLAAQPESVQMLLEEAHLAAHVHHPNVVETIEVGTTDDGRHFLVMSYVEGVSLDDLLSHPKLDAIRRVRLGLSILLDAMSGADAIHRATDPTSGQPLGIVHRDISPANILVGFDGLGRLTDFGIAAVRGDDPASRAEIVRGTPRYIAPEQARGAAPDPRSDVFALGAVLWEVITGEQLFDSPVGVADILQQVVSATIPPPSDRNSRMPEALDRICLRALERDLSQRYASVAEMRAALVQVAAQDGLLAKPAELAAELSSLFAERMAQRRELLKRRDSGTVQRAVVVVAEPAYEPSFEDSVTIFRRSDAGTRKSLAETQIGLPPLPEARTSASEDEERYRLPRHAWRRWAALGLTALALLAVYALSRGSDAPEPAHLPQPIATATAQRTVEPKPAPVPVPAAAVVPAEPTAPAAPEAPAALEADAVAAEPVAPPPRAKRTAIKRPAPPREEVDDLLPLETNPYRSRL